MRLIDADALDVAEEVGAVCEHMGLMEKSIFEAFVTGWLGGAIDEAPTIDAVPAVRGEWMPVYESEMTGWNPAVAGRDQIGGYICSACKEEAVYDCNDKFVLSNYCPHCGADNRGSEER